MAELTGQILGGRYRVETFLGQGGMADVYKVRDLQRAVFLAMKVLHADLAEDQAFMRNFEHEAQTLERLQHPNIVRYYGYEHIHDLSFILMDFIDGLTLRREISLYKNSLRLGRILEIMQPVCAALFYAHQMGMIHCDIKPANIITHRNSMVYLTDFGIAHRSESTTQPLMGVGSPAYMAPEQFDNHEPTHATDIYSLGVVLYEMLTGGQRPFTGDSARAQGSTTRRIIWEKKNIQPQSPCLHNPDITPELEAVVMTCLQRAPRRRFRSTLELYQALETAIRGRQPEDDAQTRTDLPGSRKRPAANKPLESKTPTEIPQIPGAGSSSGGDGSHLAGGLAEIASLPVADVPPTPEKVLGEEKPRQVKKAPTAPARASQTVKGPPASGPAASLLVPPSPAAQYSAPLATLPALILKELAKPGNRLAKIPVVRRIASAAADGLGRLRKKITVGLNATPRWLLVSAASVALVLVAFAIYNAAAQAPGGLPTPDTPAPTAVSAVNGTGTPTSPNAQPTKTRLPLTAAALPAVQPAAAQPTPTETPPPHPTPVGGSEQIAFASDRSGTVQVWVMEASDPENRRQVTKATGGACQPAWSPDGEQIAYTTPCKGPSVYFAGATIKLVQLDSGEVTDLPVKSAGVGGAFDPAWSPDGKTLAYTAVLGSKTEIRTIDLESLQVKTLASQGLKNAQPAWSRDGKFISYIFTNDANWDALWYMHANGESKEQLARSGQFSEPVWTPDGLHILASISQGSGTPTLAMFDRANPTASAAEMLPGSYRMSHASISPDGGWLVFWTDKAGSKPEIMLASIDGKTVRALTNNELRDFHPAWSPR